MTQQQQWDETRQRVDSEKGKSSSEAIKGSLSDFLSVKRISNVTSMESSAERRGIVESSFGEQEFLGQSVDVGMGVDRDGGILVGRVMREPYNDDDLWFSTPEQGAEGGWGFEDVMAKTPTGPDRRIRTLLPWPTEDPRYQQALEAASTSSSPEGVALRGHLSSVKTEKTEQQWDEARQRAEDVQARRENAVAAEVPYDPFDAARDAAMDPPDEYPSFDELAAMEIRGAERKGDRERTAQLVQIRDRHAAGWAHLDQRNPHHPDTQGMVDRFESASFDAYDVLYTGEGDLAAVNRDLAGELKALGAVDPVEAAAKRPVSPEAAAQAAEQLRSSYQSPEAASEQQLG